MLCLAFLLLKLKDYSPYFAEVQKCKQQRLLCSRITDCTQSSSLSQFFLMSANQTLGPSQPPSRMEGLQSEMQNCDHTECCIQICILNWTRDITRFSIFLNINKNINLPVYRKDPIKEAFLNDMKRMPNPKCGKFDRTNNLVPSINEQQREKRGWGTQRLKNI